MSETKTDAWESLKPNPVQAAREQHGMSAYYEGDDIPGFMAEMKALGIVDFDLLVRIPGERVEEIYYSGRWPLGT